MGVPGVIVATRFGIGIRAEEWFLHRLKLLQAITIPSLLAQRDPHFIWLIYTDAEMPALARGILERAVAPLGDRVCILTGVTYGAQSLGAYCADGAHITARLDDDDALHPETMARIRSIADDFLKRAVRKPNLALTFVRGLEWVMYDMVDVWKREGGQDRIERAALREYTRPFLGTSCIMVADAGSTRSFFDISHAHEGLEADVDDCEIMMCDSTEYMWLYARHKQADSGIVKSEGPVVNWGLPKICRYFGMSEAGVRSYLDDASGHAYVVQKKSMKDRLQTQKEINAQRLSGGDTQDMEVSIAAMNENFLGQAQYGPLGKSVTDAGVVFDPQEFGIDGDARLVVFDYDIKDYCLTQIIPAGSQYTIPTNFFTHRNYKWKLQTLADGKWVDRVRYAPFAFPDQFIAA